MVSSAKTVATKQVMEVIGCKSLVSQGRTLGVCPEADAIADLISIATISGLVCNWLEVSRRPYMRLCL